MRHRVGEPSPEVKALLALAFKLHRQSCSLIEQAQKACKHTNAFPVYHDEPGSTKLHRCDACGKVWYK